MEAYDFTAADPASLTDGKRPVDPAFRSEVAIGHTYRLDKDHRQNHKASTTA